MPSKSPPAPRDRKPGERRPLTPPRPAFSIWYVLGLLLFCHAVMTAWADPTQRWFAIGGIALSVLAVFASSWDGLRARFGGRG